MKGIAMAKTWLVSLFMLVLFVSCSRASTPPAPTGNAQEGDSIAVQMERALDDEFRLWYPLCVDTVDGGYYSDINYQWELDGPQQKMIVTQARHIWSIANAAMFNPEYRRLLPYAAHGYRFLKNKMWDPRNGGFYDLVDRHGDPLSQDGGLIKTAYGNAFAIYGLATYYKVSGDTGSLQLALDAFHWLEKNSFDPVNGGYFQFISAEGVPFTQGVRHTPPKDQNSSIHLLEAFTALYDVWPDSVLRLRLASLLHLVRDTLTTDDGYLRLFFQRDWTPVSYREADAATRKAMYEADHISFGHDVETSYLMLDASEGLGIRDDSTTLMKAKKKADYALRNGFDAGQGGLFDGGEINAGNGRAEIVLDTKEWWAQVEALNTLLMMTVLFPGDEMKYYDMFLTQWAFCRKYLLDTEHGGWYWGGLDKEPRNRFAPKGTIWKAEYHTSRAMINCIRRLHNMFHGHAQFDPVNKDATPGARKLLQYLYSISGRYTLSGQHNYVALPDSFPGRVRELTGKLPEVWGCDFGGYYVKGYAEKLVRSAYEKYKEGYIITLMWHAGRPLDDPPFGWKESIQAKMTDTQWKELTTPGTALNARWAAQVDTVASYLKELQALGVPVLWRPYHEQNGVWFWWGNRKGPDGSAKLYRMMYERFVNVHHLNNLIWVWDTNTPRRLFQDEAYAYDEFFPGLDCVDVLAADVYHNDFKQSHHDELLELGKGKPIALGEVGEVPTPTILKMQPFWTWFMIWGNFVDTHNTPVQMRRLYSDPRVLTHEKFGPGW